MNQQAIDELKAERDSALELVNLAMDERDHYMKERDALRAALQQALEALRGWMDQPDTTEAYDASMTLAQAAITAAEGALK